MSTTVRASTVRIRPAADSEYAAIGELTYAAYSNDYTDLSDNYRHQLRHPEALLGAYDFFVAEDEATGGLVGTIAVLRAGHDQQGRIAPHELYFRLLATHPSARGRGIGADLTRFAMAEARRRGQRAVVLNSGPEMLGAHALYRKLGFSRRSDREDVIVLPDGRELELLTFVLDLEE
ncbi:GNAT family N-acetyltransferase [Leifsonia shinshuensis]|uniref:GNAT family N-acetyltransferase n=1 Tax=Leifsonia shinshuensis TaxID=150026 RepID=UPI001F50FB11|nr:GNAT family N-acetyltransferase [Leifsonia shinshuensis]MCI0157136.1 GNAT family N-acetyltransferase [Leifsonia shinshuensis]